MIADDLFSGAGGWDLAAAQLGIHARGVENMKEARATREAAGLSTIHDDVWTFQPDGNATGLIASPPCQTFSQAGKGSGRKALEDVVAGIRGGFYKDLDALQFLASTVGDDRTGLVLTPLHFAHVGGYEWLAWEQVPTVLPVWEACAEELERHGWHTWTGNLQAEMYGVPQTRKRAFLLASRRGPVTAPTPTHSRYYSRTPDKLDPGVHKWISMAEALGWGLVQRPSYTVTGGSGHAAASGIEWGGKSVRESLIDTAARTPQGWVLRNNSSANAAERRPEEPAPTLYFGQRSNYCAWEWRGEGPAPDFPPEWAFKRPATTVVGSERPDNIAAPGYRTTISRQDALDSIRVTVQEAGILQSFPADHPWQGAKGKQFLQAGNAIPPGLALHALGAAAGVDAREAAA